MLQMDDQVGAAAEGGQLVAPLLDPPLLELDPLLLPTMDPLPLPPLEPELPLPELLLVPREPEPLLPELLPPLELLLAELLMNTEPLDPPPLLLLGSTPLALLGSRESPPSVASSSPPSPQGKISLATAPQPTMARLPMSAVT
jgi:hypothetical protein